MENKKLIIDSFEKLDLDSQNKIKEFLCGGNIRFKISFDDEILTDKFECRDLKDKVNLAGHHCEFTNCSECGRVRIRGYCCTFCGDVN